ncbi:SRPBCC domain-containing protein [Hazenella sp. IB182357]|uniref:SRPBCC domain-containing protein n=1 Tax=Polycladospora coralii TaxID=2771432 RepID=A0A926N9M4_9BACL|nr:SRPBCC domain-containing protein [Polycladospora coralii]MBD1371060.1 SRPBCC domain-containing protein [Polycladospora coralii]
MKEIKTTIEINASKEVVWTHLMDVVSYPEWNPFMKITGELKVGERIQVEISPPQAKKMTFRPKVLVREEMKELRWLGRVLLPGIFDGEHIFEIEEMDHNHVILVHREIFKGILVPFMKKQLDQNTKQGFILMNEALKEHIEGKVLSA